RRSKPAGEHRVEWDGTNNNGRRVGSGVYFYRLAAGRYVETRKLVLLK
ncbi:MAG: FlgD immunoglobulin-like domain containing protein, partial [Planctomycetota bacterium]